MAITASNAGVQELVARVERHDSNMRPIDFYQSQYVAIVALLRSVGHVFSNVDCTDPGHKAWSQSKWKEWKQSPIFHDFIEPTRNALLKEFAGGLQRDNPGFSAPVISVDPAMPGSVSISVCLDPARVVGPDGELLMPKIRSAVAFWDQCLREAEAAFPAGR